MKTLSNAFSIAEEHAIEITQPALSLRSGAASFLTGSDDPLDDVSFNLR